MSAIELLTIRIPPDLKRQIVSEAGREAKSLNTLVREILEYWYVQNDGVRRKQEAPPSRAVTQNDPWPESQRFREWLASQDLLTIIRPPLNYEWWCRLSSIIKGLPDEAWFAKEFAKIQLWLEENPKRCPTPRGVSRFIRGWLERAYEKERRYGTAKAT